MFMQATVILACVASRCPSCRGDGLAIHHFPTRRQASIDMACTERGIIHTVEWQAAWTKQKNLACRQQSHLAGHHRQPSPCAWEGARGGDVAPHDVPRPAPCSHHSSLRARGAPVAWRTQPPLTPTDTVWESRLVHASLSTSQGLACQMACVHLVVCSAAEAEAEPSMAEPGRPQTLLQASKATCWLPCMP